MWASDEYDSKSQTTWSENSALLMHLQKNISGHCTFCWKSHESIPMFKIRVYERGQFWNMYVHANQLRQVEVHLVLGESKQFVGYISLNSKLLGGEQVTDGQRRLEHAAFHKPQQVVLLRNTGFFGHSLSCSITSGCACVWFWLLLFWFRLVVG
jgi:hypothetical protein